MTIQELATNYVLQHKTWSKLQRKFYIRILTEFAESEPVKNHHRNDCFPVLDKTSWFYENCQRNRKNNAKICQCCPFREGIEKQEIL